VAACVRERQRSTAALASTSWLLRSLSGDGVDGERVIATVAKRSSDDGAARRVLRRQRDHEHGASAGTNAIVRKAAVLIGGYVRAMRVVSIELHDWRNFGVLRLEVPREAQFICLVGENGTGKSSLLELITWAAHQAGISAQAPLRRPFPQPTPGEHMAIDVVFEAERDELRSAIITQPVEVKDNWDGTLIVRARGWAGDDPIDVPPGLGFQSVPGVGGAFTAVLAGGVPLGFTVHAGGQLVAALREFPALLHLYIDAERVFPQAEVRDEEILALARQDPTLPGWIKQQASQLTQNLYLEWMRSMLGRQQRMQSEFFQAALQATERDEEVPRPTDPLATYRSGLAQVLPHLRFVRLDQEQRRLLFDSAGTVLPYESLSVGVHVGSG
jgi:hypothetical protein